MASDSNLVLVDWVTSGRHESGEEWDFELYKSTNQIYLEGNEPLFLDTVLLEKGNVVTVAERMQGYRVVAMIILLGPKLKRIQVEVQENVKRMMSEQLRIPSNGFKGSNSNQCWSKPIIVASCSPFGAKGTGMVVRIAAVTTESVYKFLQNQLAGLETMLGVSPYS